MKQKINIETTLANTAQEFYIDSVYLDDDVKTNPQLFVLANVRNTDLMGLQVITRKSISLDVETNYDESLPVKSRIVGPNQQEMLEDLRNLYKGYRCLYAVDPAANKLNDKREIELLSVVCGGKFELKIVGVYALPKKLAAVATLTCVEENNASTEMRFVKDCIEVNAKDAKNLPVEKFILDSQQKEEIKALCDKFNKEGKCLYTRNPFLYDKVLLTTFAPKTQNEEVDVAKDLVCQNRLGV